MSKEKAEYENAILRLPKKLMEFLKRTAGIYGPDPISYFEFTVVDAIRANIEATTGEEIINWNNLGPVFREILKDTRRSAQLSCLCVLEPITLFLRVKRRMVSSTHNNQIALSEIALVSIFLAILLCTNVLLSRHLV